jgi:cytochrome b
MRWGWWTLLITLPLQMLIDVTVQFLPWIIIAALLFIGISILSGEFMVLYYALVAVVAIPLVWFGCKACVPKCANCGGVR